MTDRRYRFGPRAKREWNGFVGGSRAMAMAAVEALEELRVAPDQVHARRFAGA
jgi:hypothetical protein